MRPVPWWAMLSAASAPVLLIGGWTLAASRQPGGFDSFTETISALAARGAADRWIMTTGLAGLGVCHVVTALGLRPAAPPARVTLAVGGVATILVAAFPQPAGGSSTAHFWAAATGFVTLSLWPALAWWGTASPFRPAPGVATGAALLAVVVWFAVELSGKGQLIGLSERCAAGSQALCPLATVWLLRRRQR
jgi:hypothetical membrane protein